MKEPVKPADMDKNLRLLLKTWTYLEWNEKNRCGSI
jgi:hypothetical protein